ncbi:hypothetical protein EVAR_81971_1 [Eumeta japonica]|uniref:Uncharacterized protein n=1 Tax=Eumeta variegata TaxID=151549 RepID=A0A4C1VUU4_EUMVA|nr:hypothetical protein EVAR_81971_1 [Eumeta japonica]
MRYKGFGGLPYIPLCDAKKRKRYRTSIRRSQRNRSLRRVSQRTSTFDEHLPLPRGTRLAAGRPSQFTSLSGARTAPTLVTIHRHTHLAGVSEKRTMRARLTRVTDRLKRT